MTLNVCSSLPSVYLASFHLVKKHRSMVILPSRKLKREESLKKALSVRITRDIRSSGLLAFLSPEDLQTLITLSTFADESGRCDLSARTLGQALNLSENQAHKRLKKLCKIRWQGRPLVAKENGREKGKFLATTYRLMEVEGLKVVSDGKFKVSKSDHSGSSGEDRAGRVGELDAAPQRKQKSTPEAPVVKADDSCVGVNDKHTTEKEREVKEGEKEKVLSMLLNCGVSMSIATKLLKRYPTERITRQIEMLPFRNAREPAAMLINAIMDDWAAPAAYMARRREEAERKAKAEEEAREAERRGIWQKKIEEAKAKLSPEQLQEITKRAREKVSRRLSGILHGKVPEVLVRSEVNGVIARRYLNPVRDSEGRRRTQS